MANPGSVIATVVKGAAAEVGKIADEAVGQMTGQELGQPAVEPNKSAQVVAMWQRVGQEQAVRQKATIEQAHQVPSQGANGSRSQFESLSRKPVGAANIGAQLAIGKTRVDQKAGLKGE